ncbi:hypothetical protein B0H34DRAFT_108805 [Crassisporium funariophilum]|nr:hypothetical protein B0H34DRAFT_108805 [Crassisporium funariophilum]
MSAVQPPCTSSVLLKSLLAPLLSGQNIDSSPPHHENRLRPSITIPGTESPRPCKSWHKMERGIAREKEQGWLEGEGHE